MNRCNRPTVTVLSILAFGAVVVDGPPTGAATMFWGNAAGGSASVPGNWAPAQMPTAADALLYGVNGTFTVTFNSSVAQSLTQNVGSGTVTLSFGSPHTTQNLLVADSLSQTSSAIVMGDLDATLVRLGNLAANDGTLTLDGFSSTIGATTTIVGDDGAGTLNVIFGSSFSAGALTVGRFGTATGLINVNDAPTFPPNSPVLSATTAIVGELGDGTLHVFDDGHAQFDSLTIALNSGGTGTVDIDDGSLSVDGNVNINTTGAFLVGNGASVVVDGTTFINGSGDLIFNGAGQFRTTNLNCAAGAGLALTQGTLIVDGGALVPPSDDLVLDPASGVGALVELRNRATMTLGSFSSIQVDQGEFRVTSGSTVNAGPASVIVGADPGQAGVLTIADGASLTAVGPIAGAGGDGAIVVDAGGTLTASSGIALGMGSTSFGTLDVQGVGAHVTTPNLHIGGAGGTAGNIGIVTIHDDGLIEVTAPGSNTRIYDDGVVHVLQGGTLDITDDVLIEGNLNMLGGAVHADGISCPGELSGYGTVDSRFTFNSGGVITGDPGGTLIVGDSSNVNGFANANLGIINVGAGSVRILDAGGFALGDATLAGGTLEVPNGTVLQDNISGIVLSGHGTIKGNLTNNATVTSTGAGLHIADKLTSSNQTINGTRITFDNEGEFSGFGTIDCSVTGAAGSTITATGNLTMGDPLDASGVSLSGTLDVGTHTVTMLDLANGVPLGTLTKLNGGTLVQGIRVSLGAADVLSGTGTIQSQLQNTGGIIRPGGVNLTGTLTVTGSFFNGSGAIGGDLELEITSLSNVDNIICNNPATLDGDLIVTPINGFVPVLNQEFVVLTASSITGSFDSVVLQNAPSSLAAEAIVSATQVKVKIVPNPCPFDVSPPGGNSAVNVDDLLGVIAAWGVCPAPPADCPADVAPFPNGNGQVNVDDLLAVIGGWGACP